MRSLLVMLGGLILAALVVGCSTDNPAAPVNISPRLSTLETPNMVSIPTPAAIPGFYGTISNLNLAAGTFTLTSPSGNTEDVTTSPGTLVRFQGSTSPVGTSSLQDGEKVSVSGTVTGLPQQARVRAALIVINSRPDTAK